MSRPLYTTFAWAYDLVVPSPAPPQPAEVARLFAGRKRLVDVGCGTGVHAAFLAGAGFAVTGIDESEQMLAVARERAPEVHFEQADLFDWRPGEPVDGVLCRGVLTEVVDDDRRGAAVRSLFEMLGPGGLLVLSVHEIEQTHIRYGREPVTSRSEGGVFFRAEHRFVGDRVVVEETLSSEDQHADHRFEMRPWSLTEVDERLADAGFSRIERKLEGDRVVAACIR